MSSLLTTSLYQTNGRQRQELEASPGKINKTLSQKQNKNKRAGHVAQVLG
jgi:hypothetical protein